MRRSTRWLEGRRAVAGVGVRRSGPGFPQRRRTHRVGVSPLPYGPLMSRSTAPLRRPTARWGARHAVLTAPYRAQVSAVTLPGVAAEDAAEYGAADAGDPAGSADERGAGAASPGPDASGADGGRDDGVVDVDEVRAVVGRVVGQLRGLVEQDLQVGGDGDTAALDGCVTELRKLEGTLHALQAKVVGCLQQTRAHDDVGLTDTAALLRERLGVSGREAKRRAEFAQDLAELDATAEALADGRIAPEHAQAIGRTMREGRLGDAGAAEQELLDTAQRSSPEQLRDDIRRREQAADPEHLRRQENRAYNRRRASLSRREDGMFELHALLDPESGERVAVALDAFTTPDPKGTPPEERRRPEQRTADGLVELADAVLGAGRRIVGGVKPHVAVTIPLEALEAKTGQVGVSDRRTVLSAQAVQRLLCDAAVSRVLTRGRSQILDVGRARQSWSASQRRALVVRDGGCRGPGCDRPVAWCDAHHIRWWTNGGDTNLDNGLLLCRYHHRMVHERRWTVQLDPITAEATFRSPIGDIERTTLPHGQQPQPD